MCTQNEEAIVRKLYPYAYVSSPGSYTFIEVPSKKDPLVIGHGFNTHEAWKDAAKGILAGRTPY